MAISRSNTTETVLIELLNEEPWEIIEIEIKLLNETEEHCLKKLGKVFLAFNSDLIDVEQEDGYYYYYWAATNMHTLAQMNGVTLTDEMSFAKTISFLIYGLGLGPEYQRYDAAKKLLKHYLRHPERLSKAFERLYEHILKNVEKQKELKVMFFQCCLEKGTLFNGMLSRETKNQIRELLCIEKICLLDQGIQNLNLIFSANKNGLTEIPQEINKFIKILFFTALTTESNPKTSDNNNNSKSSNQSIGMSRK